MLSGLLSLRVCLFSYGTFYLNRPSTSLILGFSISATDWMEGSDEPSWKTEDTVKIAPILAEHGVDLIDVSTGGNTPLGKSHPLRSLKAGGAYQAPFAEAVKKAAGSKILVGAVGTIVNGHLAQGVLEKEQADVALVGRQFQKNPGSVWAFAEDLGVELYHAHQIEWGFKGRAASN